MDTVLPRCHSMTFQIKEKIIKEDIWELSVPPTDKLEWCIVLSCLTSMELLEGFSNYLKVPDIVKLNIISTSNSYNLFLDRFSCFENVYFKELVKIFADEKMFENTTHQKCEAFLQNFPIIRLSSRVSRYNVHTGSFPLIILFTSDEDETAVNLGLRAGQCVKMRRKALKYILRTMEINEETTSNICSAVVTEGNLLIALLKSENRKKILDLYDSSYALLKLKEAGYEVDPRTKDKKGLSALYYALLNGDFQLYTSLYQNAVNHCGSFRNPNSEVVSNLRLVENILANDIFVSENELPENRKAFVQKTLRTLRSITSFFIKIAERIMQITNEHISSSNHNPKSFKATQQRNIIIAILNTYLIHFNSVEHAEKVENASHLEDYIIYKYYYDVIDVSASVLFFDNIYQLKKNLSLRNKSDYEKIESAFFISVLSYVTFNEKVKKCKEFDQICFETENSPYKVLLSIRADVENKINLFLHILENITIDENNLRKEVPPNEFNTSLDSYPEIKDYFLIERLNYYLKHIHNIKEINNMKSVFVIERILQVLGEFMKLSPENDFSIKWFLSLYIPRNIRKVLHEMRDKLSHVFRVSCDYENKFSLFEHIRTEIIYICNYLEPLFIVFSLRMMAYVKKNLEDLSQEMKTSEIFKCTFENYTTHMIKNITGIQSVYFQEHSLDSLIIVIKFITKHLNEEVNLNVQKFSKKSLQVKQDLKSRITQIKQMFQPLMSVIQWTQAIQGQNKENILLEQTQFLEFSELFTECNNSNSLKNLIDAINNLIRKCNTFISEWEVKGKLRNFSSLKNTKNIQKFLRDLKHPSLLSEEEKCEIRRQIPETVNDDIKKRDQILLSIKNGLFLNNKELAELKLSYFSKRKWKRLEYYYRNKKYDQAKKILEILDPLTELNNAFCLNHIEQKIYDKFFDLMKLSDKPKILNNFKKLLYGAPKKKCNRLSVLLDHIRRLKKITIDEDRMICLLWNKSEIQDENMFDHSILSRYIENLNVRFSTEILIIRCMSVLDKDSFWYKTSLLYTGINLRNVIAHGNIILEKICEFLNPQELPLAVMQKVKELITDESTIVEILNLYKKANESFEELQRLITPENSESDANQLQNIRQCPRFQTYLKLLPDAPPSDPNTDIAGPSFCPQTVLPNTDS